MDHWSRWVILSLLSEAGNGIGRCWLVCTEETSVVVLDESITACTISEIMHAEGIWFDLGVTNNSCVIAFEYVRLWNAVCGGLSKHFIFIF